MRNAFCRLATGFMLAVAAAALPVAASAAGPIAHVGGGGTAVFDDPRFEGGTTQFAFGVSIDSDGSATGEFTCLIRGILTLNVMATEGVVHDDGSVSIAGVGIVHFTDAAGGGTVVFDATLDVTPGGPGVGTFCLAPPTFSDTDCDHETVVNGRIVIVTR